MEAQVLVLAVTVKGDDTLAPLNGVATVMSEVVAFTVMFSKTWSFTFCPQHFTCRTWDPGLAVTYAENDVGSMVAVPLSIEYPMETAVSPAHVFVLAVNRNGEDTVAPLDGVDTVMACEGTVKVVSANAAKSKVFISQPRVIWR